MDLKLNKALKDELWDNHGTSMLQQFEPSIQELYPHIFALQDSKTLLSLESSLIQERVELIQACMLEGMVKLALDEIMAPLKYRTELPAKDRIHIHSECKLGMIHEILENPKAPGFLLQRLKQTDQETTLDSKTCPNLDIAINTIAGVEEQWRQQKSRKAQSKT
jgi:hypothetical protein